MDSVDFITINDILFNVLQTVDDVEFREGLSEGWYTQQVRDGLDELAYDTFFDQRTVDLDFPTKTFALDMPKNAFNLREIYLFTNECCRPETSVRVNWKRLFNNKGKGPDYTAKRVEAGRSASPDPFFPNSFAGVRFDTFFDGNHFANVQNGQIMFSSQSSGFTKVRLVFNGLGEDVDDLPVVPRFFKQAITYWVVERFFEVKKTREPRRFSVLHRDAFTKMTLHMEKAERRIKSLNKWQRDDMNEYLGRINA